MFRDKLKKYTPFLIVLVVYGVFGVIAYNNYINKRFYDDAGSILLRYGSRGSDVIFIQTRLKDWGYYKGKVDGIYGWATRKAVIDFQKKNGLKADGVVGDATGAAIGMNVAAKKTGSSSPSRSSSEYTLAQCIHGEARGEPYVGQVAVGAVILNRVDDPRFPNTIAGVIYQPGAFTAVSDGQMFQEPGDSALKAARDALNGWDPSGGALYYYNPAKTTNKWIWSRPIVKVIGKHYFCK